MEKAVHGTIMEQAYNPSGCSQKSIRDIELSMNLNGGHENAIQRKAQAH